MLNLRRCVVAVVAVLLMSGAALAQTQTATNNAPLNRVLAPSARFARLHPVPSLVQVGNR